MEGAVDREVGQRAFADNPNLRTGYLQALQGIRNYCPTTLISSRIRQADKGNHDDGPDWAKFLHHLAVIYRRRAYGTRYQRSAASSRNIFRQGGKSLDTLDTRLQGVSTDVAKIVGRFEGQAISRCPILNVR